MFLLFSCFFSIKNQIINEEQTICLSDELNCEDSLFQNCQFPTNLGGAIFSNVKTSINSCIFQYCSSKKGGSIYCCNYFTIKNTYIQSSEAINGGCFIISSTKAKKIFIQSNSLLTCKATNKDGCFSLEDCAFTHTLIKNLNITSAITEQSSLISIQSNIINISFFILTQSISNNCLVFNTEEQISQISNSIFSDINSLKTTQNNKNTSLITFLRKSRSEIIETIFNKIYLFKAPYFNANSFSTIFITITFSFK